MAPIFSILSAVLATATAVNANGIIDLWSNSGCSGSLTSQSYTPPGNCNGGCVPITGGQQSVSAPSTDGGYGFTVYSDRSCSDDARLVQGCVSGNLGSFSYDCD